MCIRKIIPPDTRICRKPNVHYASKTVVSDRTFNCHSVYQKAAYLRIREKQGSVSRGTIVLQLFGCAPPQVAYETHDLDQRSNPFL